MLDAASPEPSSAQARIAQALDQIESIIVGKPRQVRLALCSLLAGGHLLIEDLPGVGKTTLAHAMAAVFGLNFSRIQFTSDLLPADILGVSIYDPASRQFSFHPGPIFAHCVLADEMNRATPKTQSALLEAMEERQITVDGQTHPLKKPFFVIGTQNPLDQAGTFPLPESQLDRFMMRLSLGYPDAAAERRLLEGESGARKLDRLRTVIDIPSLIQLQQQVEQVHASPALLDYLQALVVATRDRQRFLYGLSPRAALALLAAARAWALMQGRAQVEPADLQAVLPAVAGHRLVSVEERSQNREDLVGELLEQVAIP
jgi:MoxR-like ATPase